MSAEKQTVACQIPNFSLPEYTLYAVLLFFVSKIAVLFLYVVWRVLSKKTKAGWRS